MREMMDDLIPIENAWVCRRDQPDQIGFVTAVSKLNGQSAMGEILERVDITSLLDDARKGQVDRTQERIDAAIEEARKARAIQDEVLKGADTLDIANVIENSYTTEQVAQIIKRALP